MSQSRTWLSSGLKAMLRSMEEISERRRRGKMVRDCKSHMERRGEAASQLAVVFLETTR